MGQEILGHKIEEKKNHEFWIKSRDIYINIFDLKSFESMGKVSVVYLAPQFINFDVEQFKSVDGPC